MSRHGLCPVARGPGLVFPGSRPPRDPGGPRIHPCPAPRSARGLAYCECIKILRLSRGRRYSPPSKALVSGTKESSGGTLYKVQFVRVVTVNRNLGVGSKVRGSPMVPYGSLWFPGLGTIPGTIAPVSPSSTPRHRSLSREPYREPSMLRWWWEHHRGGVK